MASFIGDYDIQAAWRCLEPFADDPGKRYAHIAVVEQWAKQDPETAGSWIKGIAIGNARDNALAAYAGASTQSHDPSAALAWALDISNESLRVKTMESSAGTWLYRDPVAACAWVEKSTLPSNIKQQLLKKNP